MLKIVLIVTDNDGESETVLFGIQGPSVPNAEEGACRIIEALQCSNTTTDVIPQDPTRQKN